MRERLILMLTEGERAAVHRAVLHARQGTPDLTEGEALAEIARWYLSTVLYEER